MKRLLIFLLSVFAFSVSLMAMKGKVTYIEGYAQVNYAPAELRQIVQQGDYIQTHRGKIEIALNDGTLVRIGPDSKVYFESLTEEKGKKKVSIKVTLGRFWTKVKKLVARDEYNVTFRTGTAGVRGTVYRLDQFEDNSARLFVYDGRVEVKGERPVFEKDPSLLEPQEINGPVEIEGPREVSMEEWVKIVEKLNVIAISSQGSPTEPAPFDAEEDKKDPWVQWNLERDALE
ncbi:MAG TPA: hypothetical protein ENN72_08245 [Firmicutes bacterium]|nr:hypothetical protein [Bacillota bacterium]